MATPIHSDEGCRHEAQTWYHVYNTNVEIKTYYCFEGDFQCQRFHNSKRMENQNIYQRCHDINKSVFGKSELKLTLCELPAYLDLLENNVTFANNTCPYDKGMCFVTGTDEYIFWIHKDNCKNIIKIDSGYFDVWTFGKHKQKFINNSVTNLLLTERIQLCGTDVWRTNHNGVIASSNYINNSVKGKLPDSLYNLSPPCEMRENNQGYVNRSLKDATKSSRRWYIYEYSVKVTVYYCVKNSTDSCTQMGFGEIDPESYHDRINRCNGIICGSPKCNLSLSVCKRVQKVDLEDDTIRQLSPKCPYSSGSCRMSNAFWTTEDICGSIRKVNEGQQTNGVIRINKSQLTLLRQGELCGEKVWYTYQDGFVASERPLQFFPSSSFRPNDLNDSVFPGGVEKNNNDGFHQTHRNSTLSIQGSTAATERSFPFSHFNSTPYPSKRRQTLQTIFLQNEEINKLQILLHCVVLLILISVLWYVFNVVVNFVSLKKLNRRRPPKERSHLFNCLSQSLTTRCIFFSQQEKEELRGSVSGIQTPQLYVTVDNELYNKSV